MKRAVTAIVGLWFVLAGPALCAAADQDIKGGKDHPLLSRMANFHISEYRESEFSSHKFIGRDKKPLSVEGRKYYIEYRLDKGAAESGELKIRRNIQDALKKIGGSVLFDDNFNRVSTLLFQKEGKETWIEVRSYDKMYRLTILEKGIVKQEVVANAEALGSDIHAMGHVSIYGIFFDTGKSEIKPESEAAIAEIAKLLQNDGGLKLYVVGHTDNVGSLDSNLKLSQERAEAVAKALSGRHGIAPARLNPHGVGPLSPVASNDTEEGKAKNRRVELVGQ